ncbi:sigma factor-like helix-turn-helix DNA-binding protein [Aurantimonas sp. A3-2-R12]|uniref:sigma factor-like helix-turn-helix DNA-binding protein n=1 Tax=Aurantimonas sp. A3-2-R12 TaxID=3114362 RepID=UPI002E18FBC4|nr:sigma factor-like helix-turn-helix DNA-binding protein [Aurantimonas sp. A3-2-R12]
MNLDIADFTDKLEDPTTVPSANRLDVTKALRLLAGRQREVVAALSLEGRSVGETANRLGVTEGAVRVAFHRGLASIAAKFGQA